MTQPSRRVAPICIAATSPPAHMQIAPVAFSESENDITPPGSLPRSAQHRPSVLGNYLRASTPADGPASLPPLASAAQPPRAHHPFASTCRTDPVPESPAYGREC